MNEPLSLIVPAYNERDRLPRALVTLRAFVAMRAVPGDLEDAEIHGEVGIGGRQ